MSPSVRWRREPLTFLAVLCLFKLWLVSGQRLMAIYDALFDDLHFVRMAHFILSGNWLGTFDQLTLIKGPGYPIWLAFNYSLGLPLLVGQHLLYIGASLCLYLTVRSLIAQRWIAIVIFTAVLFVPHQFAPPLQRVVRDFFYTSLTLLVIAGIIGVLVGVRDGRFRQSVRWAALLGFALFFLWITREEGIWIVPALVLALGVYVSLHFRQKRPFRGRVAWTPPLATLGIFLLFYGAVCGLNYSHYGLFTLVDYKTSAFQRAYGALSRVGPEAIPHGRPVPMSRAAMERLYEASPLFAELRPFLDGPGPPAEIGGGHFIWALRSAVDAAGHYGSASAAEDYYARLAAEVNAACDEGRLVCTPPHASVRPAFKSSYLPAIFRSLSSGVQLVVGFRGLEADPDVRSMGSDENMPLFLRLASRQPAPRRGDAELAASHRARTAAEYQRRLDGFKFRLLNALGSIYARLFPVLAPIALVAFLATAALQLRKRRPSLPLLVNAIVLTALATRIVLLAYIDATSFWTTNVLYLAPCYPLVVLWTGLSLVELWNSAAELRAG